MPPHLLSSSLTCSGCHFDIFPYFISTLGDVVLTNPLPVFIPCRTSGVLLHATLGHDDGDDPLSRHGITMVTAQPVERFHAYFRRPQEADSITIPMLQVEKPRG